MDRLTKTGSQLPIYYYRPQATTLRQKLFRSAFGVSEEIPDEEDPPAGRTDADQAAEDAAAPDDPTKPRHRGFTLPAAVRLNTEVGRQIGYDYAIASLPPPDGAPLAFQEGYHDGRRKRSHRAQHTSIFERKVLRLRYSAWRRNRLFDAKVTADYLRILYRKFCPVTRIQMTSGTGLETDATVERVFNGATYAVGNLAFISAKANWAKANRTLDELIAIVESQNEVEGMSRMGWERLAAISNMYQPDPAALRLMPMHVLPPTGLLVNNPTVLLQEAVSSIASGWETPQLQALMRNTTPGKQGKRTFDNLVEFLRGAILRELRSGRKLTPAWTLENAWQQPEILERYLAWYASLGKAQVHALLETNARLRPLVVARASPDILDAWGLATRGYDRSDEFDDERTAVA